VSEHFEARSDSLSLSLSIFLSSSNSYVVELAAPYPNSTFNKVFRFVPDHPFDLSLMMARFISCISIASKQLLIVTEGEGPCSDFFLWVSRRNLTEKKQDKSEIKGKIITGQDFFDLDYQEGERL
jgi:hypothetical protein